MQMLLINTSTFQLHEFTEPIPRYVTFSCITDKNGPSFEEMAQIQTNPYRDSLSTIQRACGQARAAGSEWLWNDAACVDKRSSAAQSEAINSLAQIYWHCEFNIVYLDDLDVESPMDDTIGEKLAKCRWTRNIWAIPQIIFSGTSYFYSPNWIKIGDKISLLSHLSSTMGIDQPVLRDPTCIEDYSVARRMSWASGMSFARNEDLAYALLGLFDVSMPITYGEGRKAFRRLQEEILKNTDDFSLLAWETLDAQDYNGLLAQSPDCFSQFKKDPIAPLQINGEVQIHCPGVTIKASLWRTPSGLFLPLEGQDGPICWIPLSQWENCFVRRGTQVYWDLPGPTTLENTTICVKRDVSPHVSRKISAHQTFFRKDQPHPLEPIRGTGSTKLPISCTMSHNSCDKTGIMALSIEGGDEGEDYGTEMQPTASVAVSENTSRGDQIVWSTCGEDSVVGTLSATEIVGRPSWTHEIGSEAYNVSESCCIADAGELVQDETQESTQLDGSPSTETDILDLARFKEELADIAVAQFLSGFQRQSVKRSFAPWQNQDRKRPKLMESPDHLVVETSDSEDGETVVIKKASFFACPFYVRDKKHAKCVTRHQLQSIEDVREHVCWEHRQPRYCPVCKEEFPSSKSRDTHIRLRACQMTMSTVEGVTYGQGKRLNKVGDKAYLSDDLQWFQIWDIIFPEIARPSSHIYTGQREVSVCSFRQFWMQSGEDIVGSFLQEKALQSYDIRNEKRKLEALCGLVMESAVDRIFLDRCDPVNAA